MPVKAAENTIPHIKSPDMTSEPTTLKPNNIHICQNMSNEVEEATSFRGDLILTNPLYNTDLMIANTKD